MAYPSNGTQSVLNRRCHLRKMPLSEGAFICKEWGMKKDRDMNAAQEILESAAEGHSESQTLQDDIRPLHGSQMPMKLGSYMVFG